MINPDRFMNEVFRIIKGALRLDVNKVRNYTAYLADNLQASGENETAERLRQMLKDSDSELRPTSLALARALPVDPESRFALLERVNLKATKEAPPVFSESQWEIINEFVSVAKSQAQLEAAGIGSSLSMLMSGPPGTGKSCLARYLARELDLELYVARLDGLISSFLGSTSKNIRSLFEFASQRPCVLFLDEFDAIAKLRSDAQELGELKRVVNSFIQNLDLLGKQSVILAATNHEDLLDSAVWRRFSFRLTLGLPDAEARNTMWHTFLGGDALREKPIKLLTDLSEGFTGSEIEETCLRLRRSRTASQTQISAAGAMTVLLNLSGGAGKQGRFLAALQGRSAKEIARALRQRNPKIYSHSSISQLLGVSKASASRFFKGD